MNKKLINIIFISLFFYLPFTYGKDKETSIEQEMVKCAPELQLILNKIQRLPEAQKLLETIQKEGPIQIVIKNVDVSNQFGAFWDPTERLICLAFAPHITQGSLIGSILFELHNAAVSSKFDHFDELAYNNKIDKEPYVRSKEYLEYVNSLNAAKMAEKGIVMGIFPRDAYLFTYPSFEEHYADQKMSGHAGHFARMYDQLSNAKKNKITSKN